MKLIFKDWKTGQLIDYRQSPFFAADELPYYEIGKLYPGGRCSFSVGGPICGHDISVNPNDTLYEAGWIDSKSKTYHFYDEDTALAGWYQYRRVYELVEMDLTPDPTPRPTTYISCESDDGGAAYIRSMKARNVTVKRKDGVIFKVCPGPGTYFTHMGCLCKDQGLFRGWDEFYDEIQENK